MTIRKKIAENPPTLPETLPLLLTTKEAAAYLGVSAAALNKARCTGKIGNRTEMPPFVRVGGKVYYRLSDLQDWVASLETRKAV